MPTPTPAAANPPPDNVVFGRFDGLKNTVGRERLGPKDLAKAVNVDLDDAGQARRRRGRTRVATGAWHSLWVANDWTVYGVKDGRLGVVNPDYSFRDLGVAIGAGWDAGEFPVAFCQVGTAIYFSSAGAAGIVDHPTGRVAPWGPPQDLWLSPVLAPSASLPAIAGRLVGAPPKARFLAYYNGRIYLATDNVVWATELYAYGLIDKTKTFMMFEGQVTMLGAVGDGLYVGTDEGCYYLGGARLAELKKVRVMDSAVVPGSMVYIPSELANPPQVGADADTPLEVSLGFFTLAGFCVGSEGGRCLNLTESKMFFPVAERAAAMFRRQDGVNQYVICADSQGEPLTSARIGDTVDAEIIRGAAWVDTHERMHVYDGGQ